MELRHAGPRRSWLLSCGVIVTAITLIGMGLRFYAIGSESLWLDEGFSVLAARRPLLDVIKYVFRLDLHPPLYYVLLHFWIVRFGDSEIVMRTLSAIFGILSIPLVYRLGRDLMDRKTAVLAAFLTAISVYHIYFAQEVRGYSLFAFMALLSMIFWIRLLSRPGFASIFGYVICTALVLYSHPYGVFHVACQNVMFVILWFLARPLRIGWPGWIGIQSLLGILFSPWMLVTMRNISRVHQGQTIKLIPNIWDLPGALKAFAGDADFISDGSGERFWLGGTFVLLMLLGLWPSRWPAKRRTGESEILREESPVRRRGVVLVSIWLACTILMPYAVSMLSTPVFSNRYMISGSFAFLLLVARGVRQIPWQPLQWAVGVGVLLSQVGLLVPYYTQVNKEQWREAASYIETRAHPDELLLFHAPYCRTCIYWYYTKQPELARQGKGYPSKSDPREVNPDTIREELLPLLKDRNRICLILAHSFDEKGLIRKALEQSFLCSDSRQFYRISVWFYQRKDTALSGTLPRTDPSSPSIP